MAEGLGSAGMMRQRINRLPGMRDATGNSYELVQKAQESFTTYLRESGYEVIDTPLLEKTELFVRKSGGALTSRLYTFTDPGGHKVSLRPEFTSSVIRHFIEESPEVAVPLRWQYWGPVFRYEEDMGGYRQFTQVGVELVGAPGIEADLEVIGLAVEGLEKIGVRGCEVRVGHLGVLNGLLSTYGLSEAAKQFIISNVQGLKAGEGGVATLTERAQQVGMLKARIHQSGETSPTDLSTDSSTEEAQELIQGVLRESMPAPVGRRTPEQIVARMLRKVRDADDPGTFGDALSLASQLVNLKGTVEVVLAEARRITYSRGMPASGLDELHGLVDALAKRKTAETQVKLDLGLARGISYYTGVIFDLTVPNSSPPVSLGGGGRYDGLIKALGGDEDVPALGFAYNLDQVVGTLDGASTVVSQASTAQ